MRKVSLIVASAFVFLSNLSIAASKTGEFVNYTLDNGDRSSSVIENGSVVFKIGNFNPGKGQQGTYRASLAYDLNIVFVGNQKGEIVFNVPNEYFADDFMTKLQAAGTLDLGEFKIKYLGKEDVQLTSGAQYPACDHVLVYDIKAEKAFGAKLVEGLTKAFALQEGAEPVVALGFEDAKIRFHVVKGIAAVGAVQLDVAATVSGFDAVAGFDLVK